MIEEGWVDGNGLWADFCSAHRAAAVAEQDPEMPRVRINKLVARAEEPQPVVMADAAAMAALRALDPTSMSSHELATLDMLLALSVDKWEESPAAFLPSVGLVPEVVDIAAGFYFAGIEEQDRAHDMEAGPYATRVPGSVVPAGVLLIQVDLLSLATAFSWRACSTGVFADAGLPTEGVLQLFHTTTGDSITAPHINGGGARPVYLAEPELSQREPLDVDAFDYPVSRPSPSLLPTFAATPVTGDALETVLALQNEADRTAGMRVGVDVPIYWYQKAPMWTRMLGLPHHAYGLRDGDRDVLDKELPLVETGDRHVLLFNLASERQYDGVFGDEGRLEGWIRRSDLTRKEFSYVVSFWRST